MKKFDVIVIGAGSGLNIADAAHSLGKSVAIIEEGPLGGTCLNRGCIPSKILIHAAEIAESIKNADEFGINVTKYSINFGSITKKVNDLVAREAKVIEKAICTEKGFTLYKDRARFIGHKTLKVGKDTLTADKIFIVAGTRPFIPMIEGIDKIDYMTSTEALKLRKLPKSIVILGGGYIAAELAHFFTCMGSKVTIVQQTSLLLQTADEEIARTFTGIFSKKCNLLLNCDGKKVHKSGKNVVLTVQDASTGKFRKVTAEKLLVAAGRVPNSDILEVRQSGIQTNERGYIKVNSFLETNIDGIWALGDIAGIYMFKHSANLEAQYAFHNAFYPNEKMPVDYSAMPYAVFSSPQIAGVGLTEKDALAKKLDCIIGRYYYKKTGMGEALQEKDGYVKVIIDKKSRKILGCHIIGPEASTLIHEVVVAMKTDGTIDAIRRSVHIHPALNEVVQRAFNSIDL